MLYRKRMVCRVQDGRIRFVCPNCRKKSSIVVRPDEKRRSVTCKNCNQKCECELNRRRTIRERQSGKAQLRIVANQLMIIHLQDVSCDGVGFTVLHGQGRKLRVGQELQGIVCDWNPQFSRHKLVVQNISGDKIGVKFCRYGV